MQNTNTPITISSLIDRTREHLETLKYKPETIRVYERVWDKLKIHFKNETTDTLSVELCDCFLVETYGFGLRMKPLSMPPYAKMC